MTADSTPDTAHLYQDDGLLTPRVGPWVSTKHQKLAYYSSMFSTGMKKRWQCGVYLELFSGAGKSRTGAPPAIVPGSPLLALDVKDPYDKYIFCEQDPASMAALRSRIERSFPDSDVACILGDANVNTDQILGAVPTFSRGYRGLTFCFADPYKLSQLRFATLKRLADALYIDFLVLIPTYMDANRNERRYTEEDCSIVDDYLGSRDWRNRWRNASQRPAPDFGHFVADEFGRSMQSVGFLYEGVKDYELVRMTNDKNQRLYHLALFSKNNTGLQFWRKMRRNTNPPRLFELD